MDIAMDLYFNSLTGLILPKVAWSYDGIHLPYTNMTDEITVSL